MSGFIGDPSGNRGLIDGLRQRIRDLEAEVIQLREIVERHGEIIQRLEQGWGDESVRWNG